VIPDVKHKVSSLSCQEREIPTLRDLVPVVAQLCSCNLMMDSLKNVDMKSKGIEEGIHEVPGEHYALNNMDQIDLEGKTHVTTEAGGVAVIEASQMVFGKHGKKIMWLG